MRIAFVSQEYPPETGKGGIATQTYLKAHGFAAMGHEVHVVAHALDGHARVHWDGGVEVTRITGFYGRMHVRNQASAWLTYSAEVAAAIEQLMYRAPLDLVEFPEWGGEGYIHLLNRPEVSHVPVALHLHGPLVMLAHTLGWPARDSEFYRVGTQMEAACFRLADAVVSSSACSARWCLEHYHSRADEIPVIHSGVDTELFAPRAIAKAKRPTIVFVGRVIWNKGVFALLDAACKLRTAFPDLTLHLIGPADHDVLRQLERKSRGFPGLLEHTTEVGREELGAHLSRAHVFAAPSVYEGGPGFVYLEAMACGLPVIGCSGSGVAEVVEPGETGFLVPPGDAAALGAALRELLADPTRRRAMGAKARRYVLENARREECLRRLETFYRTVAARSARTAAVEASVQDSAPGLAVR